MNDPVLIRRVVGLWSLAQGCASLLIEEQLGPIVNAEKIAKAIVPDMVRELCGVEAENDAKDLKFIARSSAAARG
jgi:hypothetical protein